MQKLKTLLKMAFAAVLFLSFAGQARADELVGTYKWNIQYNNAISYNASDPVTDIIVEVYQKDATNYYIQESTGSNVFQGLTIPFTYGGGIATFPCQYVGSVGGYDNVFVQNCYKSGTYYMPQMGQQTAAFNPETGFDFKADNGFGWFVSSGPSGYSPNSAMDVVVAFLIKSQEKYEEPSGPVVDPNLIGAYYWDIQYAEGIFYNSTDTKTRIKVEVRKNDTDDSYYIQEVETNLFKDEIIPFTLKGNSAEFKPALTALKKGSDFLWITTCYLNGGTTYMPEATGNTYDFDPETGFAFKANNGFGFYTCKSDKSFSIAGDGTFAFFVLEQEKVKTDGNGDELFGSVDKILGEREWWLQPVDFKGNTADAVKVKVNVKEAEVPEGESADEYEPYYVIEEVDGTNYFPGEVKFTYNEGADKFEIAPYYGGKYDVNSTQRHTGFYGFTYYNGLTEVQNPYGFVVGDNFVFPEDQGFGWFLLKDVVKQETDEEGNNVGDPYNPFDRDPESAMSSYADARGIYKGYYVLSEYAAGNGKYTEYLEYRGLDEFEGTHTLKATVTIDPAYASITEIAPYLKEESTFKVTDEGVNISGFLGSGDINVDYDAATGEVTLKNFVIARISTPDYRNYVLSLTDKDNSLPMFTGKECPVKWTVTEDGHIVIPDFAIIDTNGNYTDEIKSNYRKLVATFTNVTVDGYDPANPQPEPEGELIGTYEFPVKTATIEGDMGEESKPMQVEVYDVTSTRQNAKRRADIATDALSYIMKETAATNYLHGITVPFQYNPGSKTATLSPVYAGEFEEGPVFFTPFVYTGGTYIETQNEFPINFDKDNGFSADKEFGIAFVYSESADEFDAGTEPKLLDAYYADITSDEEDVTYPELSVINGTHSFKADVEYVWTGKDLTENLPPELTFTIENGKLKTFVVQDSRYVDGDVNEGSGGSFSYNQEDGSLKLLCNMIGTGSLGGSSFSGGIYVNFGYSPDTEGTWPNDYANSVNTGIVWQVTPDGNIVIPDFSVVNYAASSPVLLARYTNVIVDDYDPNAQPEPAAPSLSFDDVTITVSSTSNVDATQTVDIKLTAETPFEYQGFQFDVTLPEGVSMADNTATSTVMSSITNGKSPKAEGNTYRVLAYNSDGGTSATGVIATLTLSATYDAQKEYPIETTMSIVEPIVFSSVKGDDIEGITGFEGNLTIDLQAVPATAINIGDVTLMEPSTSASKEDIDNITVGEGINIVLTLKPDETTTSTEDIVWSSDDVEGLEFSYDEEGNLIVNTDGVEVDEPTEVTIKGTVDGVSASYTFTLNPVVLGNSNNSESGDVTVADVVTTSNYITNKPVTRFDYPNANVILTEEGGKQVINTSDLTATVNIAMGENADGINRYTIKRHTGTHNTNDRLVADNFKAVQGRQITIGVALDNSYDYAALHAEVVIPEGMKVTGVSKGERAAAHELDFNITEGRVYVTLYSFSNASFINGEGNLFNLTVVADENCEDISFDNINAADAASNGYYLYGEGGRNVAGTTGIDGIDADEEGTRYFDINGIEIPRPDKGIYIKVAPNGEAVKVVK